MRRDANVGCHQVGLQTTDRLMLGAILRLEKHGVSNGRQGTTERTYAFRRPAMGKYDMRDGSDVVVPRVATKLMKAWSVGRR